MSDDNTTPSDIDETLDFCEACLNWEYGYGGVTAAIGALRSIYHPRAVQLLRDFIAKHGKADNGRDLELAKWAGESLGIAANGLLLKMDEAQS